MSFWSAPVEMGSPPSRWRDGPILLAVLPMDIGRAPIGLWRRFEPFFLLRSRGGPLVLRARLELNRDDIIVNSELCRLALVKVGNPNVLVNLVSRRVRQLNSGGGSSSRPLILDVAGLGAADIALREIIEDKMGWEIPEENLLVDGEPKKKKRRSSR